MKKAPAVMVYDGKCGFCLRWIKRWRRLTGDAVEYRAFQEVAEEEFGVSRQEFGKAVYLFVEGEPARKGAAAVARSLAGVKKWSWLWWVYQKVPAASWVMEGGYWVVARTRGWLA